jgi:hypothetical protein
MMSEINRATSRILGSLTLRRDLSSILFSRISLGVLTRTACGFAVKRSPAHQRSAVNVVQGNLRGGRGSDAFTFWKTALCNAA